MKITINTRNSAKHQDFFEYIEYRLGFAFSRIRDSIHSITITLSDINGPKGGIDKQCKVIIKAKALPAIVITERQSEIKHAIDRAIRRSGEKMIQQIKRKKIVNNRSTHHSMLPILNESS